MTIQRKNGNVIITLPETMDADSLQRVLDFIKYSQATQNSKAKQDDVDELAKEVNSSWWSENKHLFTKN